MEAPQRQAEHTDSEKLKCEWMTRREMDGESEEVGEVGRLGGNVGSGWFRIQCFQKTPLLASSLSFSWSL